MTFSHPALPPLQTLRAFLAVAETHSFTRAAQSLGLTQTAVSHQIAQLEEWLGEALFVRGAREVRLSATGERVHGRVHAALGELSDALHEVRHRGRRRGITVSTTPEFGTQWLAPRLQGFLDRYPGVSVSVTLEYRRADLEATEADLAIWLGSGGAGRNAEPLMVEQEFVVCSPGLAARLPRRQAILAAPLLRYEGARYTLLDWRRWHSQLFGIEGESEVADLIKQVDVDGGPLFATFAEMLDACRRGEGLALVRSSLVSSDLDSGALVRSFEETLASDLQYHLVTLPGQRARAEVAAFREWLLAAAQET